MNARTDILAQPIESLPGIGPGRGILLRSELGIDTLEDLLYHFPYRYFDRTSILPIRELRPDMPEAQLSGTLVNIGEEGEGRKRRLVATLYDETGRMDLVWFGPAATYIRKTLRDNTRYLVFGKINFFNGLPQISHPEIEPLGAAGPPIGLQPLYSTTQKLIGRGITNRSFAKITASLFAFIRAEDIPEIFPDGLLQYYGLCSRPFAFHSAHFPKTADDRDAALRRLKWEELFTLQLSVAKVRHNTQQNPGRYFSKVGPAFNDFYTNHLPFQLTGAQKRVLKEIRSDTATGKQMNRLLQGDVGSGKTIVALMSMLLAYDNDHQACLMAPTEILSQQHFHGLRELLEPMGIRIVRLTGSIKGKERKEILAGLADGSIPFVVGTHALIEDTVRFRSLALAVIDEQHRFGVGQRARLWAKSEVPPHVLVMTATPIPRTLAMTLYGDLEVSVIDELPPGRQEIKTIHRTDMHRPKVMDLVRAEVDAGRQAYVVYPLIEESEKLDFESLMAGYEQVKVFFPEGKYRIAMVHGRQEAGERERNMQRFISGEANILVATTVIEVGVNVPNATIMIVESAERFGLSQLHQLRGRVGRGAQQSYCILLTGNRLSEESRQRMHIMTSTSNGFVIAEQDMLLRGPGEMYGTKQSGAMKFRLADIVQDAALVEQTREAATAIIAKDPELQSSDYAPMKSLLVRSGEKAVWSKIS